MIHLIYMPFGSITHPPLALSLFKAQLQAAGMPCRVHHFNLTFAQRIGFGSYEHIALFKGVQTQVSEWLFAEQAWGEPIGPSVHDFLELCGEELGQIPKVHDPKAWLRLIRESVVPGFLQECLSRLDISKPLGDAPLAGEAERDVVVFSCTFFQTIPAIALGRLLKQQYPHLKLSYGGACFHGEMGDELIRKIPWIDAVSVGETDDVIVPLFQALQKNQAPKNLQGILHRDAQGTVHTSAPYQPVTAEVLDTLPVPNFDDFFTDAAALGLTNIPEWQKLLFLPFESSRGCWWGQKHHCSFCGLNGDGMAYRSKSPAVVLRTLEAFRQQYPLTRTYRATDNVLQTDYFKTLLPALANKPFGTDISLFYEVRVTMTRKQIKLMADAGITCVQPGIESLSNQILKLMNKGTTALQNIYFLKCCREYGILVLWNNLIQLPGETAEAYQQMEAWLPQLVHLAPPPGGSPKIECHRFSPYFNEPKKWLTHIEPAAWYQGLFPKETIDLSRIAYYFDVDWKDTLPAELYDGVVDIIIHWIRIWREADKLPRLAYSADGDGNITLTDTRWVHAAPQDLSPAASAIYTLIDAPITLKQIFKKTSGTAAEGLYTDEITAILQDFVDNGGALHDPPFYLALAIRADTIDPTYDFRRCQYAKDPANQYSKKRSQPVVNSTPDNIKVSASR